MIAEFSPETTVAVVLGAKDFARAGLESERAFEASALSFKKYLLQPTALGLPAGNVLDLFNDDRGPDAIDEAIDDFLVERRDALKKENKQITDLILFYSGHGAFVQPDDDYVLVLKCTREANVGSSAYQITSLARTLKHRVRQARRVIILDCCFAASAYSAFQSPILDVVTKQSIEAFASHGTALLCASAPDRPAKSRTKAGATSSGMTLFSESLVFALENGLATVARDRLTLAEVAGVVEELMRERFAGEGPRPQVKSPDERDGDVSKVPLFPNPAYARALQAVEVVGEFDFKPVRERYSAGVDATAAPIIVAIEQADELIQGSVLLPAERHLTVTLSTEQVSELERIGMRLSEDGLSMPDIFELGGQAWTVLHAAEKRLERLFACVRRSRVPQPVGWAGLTPLLARVHKALLVAGCSDMDSKNLLGVGDHYFWPLSPLGMEGRIEQRLARQPTVAVVKAGESGDRLRAGGEAEVVVLCADKMSEALDGLLNALKSRKPGRTRVVVGFGEVDLTTEVLHKSLDCFPCVSFAAPKGRFDNLCRSLEQTIPTAAVHHAMSSLIASFRREWVRQALKRGDGEAFRAGINWSTWSRVGRPLFATTFGAMEPPAYPHLTDLRAVATREWNFKRQAGIPECYQIATLARTTWTPETRNERFHLYLSGAGGTGKSCFLRAIHDELLDRPNALPVWYRVDAPNSTWSTVENRIRKEVEAAAELKFKARASDFLPSSASKLRIYLSQLAANLRTKGSGVDEIAIFIDQLERTFESGDQPNLERLNSVSTEIIELLREVGTGNGVRVFIASRKQYLPDFLQSYHHASRHGLHFNVLQTIGDHSERHEFVQKIWRFCWEERLIDESVSISNEAAAQLTTAAKGHPLEIVLAMVYLFSQVPKGAITTEVVDREQPADKLFEFDIRLMDKDELDKYFLLAMAHARAEIVDFAEVWWRLHLVTAELSARIDTLGPKCVLETLWLKGHLGRTIHSRTDDKGEARFLEFFHANLRDHLLRDVMALPGKTPPAWRALDRLAAAAHDWEQVQRPLDRDDTRALMVHRQSVLERTGVSFSEEREMFYFLFVRDTDKARMCAAAKECFVFSAVVHAESSRLVFLEVFPGIDERIEVCRRWLPRCAQIEYHYRILEFLVTQDTTEIRRFLATLILEESPTGGIPLWSEIAQVLAEPLYAARYRSEIALTVLRTLPGEAPTQFRSLADLPQRFRDFVITACNADRNELSSFLADCADRLEAVDVESTFAGVLRSKAALESLLEEASTQFSSGRAYLAREIEEEERHHVELVIGSGLEELVRSEAANWHRLLVERIGTPLHPFAVTVDRAAEARHEMRLRIKGKSIATEGFFPPKCQVLMRHWERTQTFIPDDIERNENEMLRETVLWMDRHYLSQANWNLPMWTASDAIVDWLEASLRVSFDDVVDDELLDRLLQHLESQKIDVFGVKPGLLRAVLVGLVREAVPFHGRWHDLIREMKRGSNDAEKVKQNARKQVGIAISEALADDTGQLAVILLDPHLEKVLVERLSQGQGEIGFAPGEASVLATDIRRHLEHSWREYDLLPVVVCDQFLRAALRRVVEAFDSRISVLSLTELSPDLRLIDAGMVSDRSGTSSDQRAADGA